MHPQLLFRLRLLLCVLLGVSAALVLPNRNPISRDTPELINVGSSNEASPESTTIYFPDHVSPNVQTASTTPSTVESLGQVTPNNNKRRQANGTQFQQSASEVKIARDDTKEPGSIYRRDGGGSNMTIIYIIVPILAVGLLIAGCICWRKLQGR